MHVMSKNASYVLYLPRMNRTIKEPEYKGRTEKISWTVEKFTSE